MSRTKQPVIDDPTLAICPICDKPTRQHRVVVEGPEGDEVEGAVEVPTYHAECAQAHPERVYSKWQRALAKTRGGATWGGSKKVPAV